MHWCDVSYCWSSDTLYLGNMMMMMTLTWMEICFSIELLGRLTLIVLIDLPTSQRSFLSTISAQPGWVVVVVVMESARNENEVQGHSPIRSFSLPAPCLELLVTSSTIISYLYLDSRYLQFKKERQTPYLSASDNRHNKLVGRCVPYTGHYPYF